ENNIPPTTPNEEGGTGGEVAGEETTGAIGGESTGPLALGPANQPETTTPSTRPTTTPGIVEGEKTIPLCATCDNIDWLLIILLLTLISLIYWYILKYCQEFKKSPSEQPAVNNTNTDNQLTQPIEKHKNNWPNLGWLGIGLLTALVYLILKNSCRLSAPDWLLITLLVDYLLLLIVNFFIKERKHWWRLFGLLLALMPVIVFIWCHPWLWWVWLIVILVYLIIMALIFANWISHRYGTVVIYLSLFLLFVLYLLSRCFC
ncbi:MAG TPA: hypothetical protein PLF15_03685, partial [bacterium]|nr:hypothetical protein [bacterium]